MHGTRASYQAGCRCILCKVANAQYQAAYRAAVVRDRPRAGSIIPAPDVRRQLQLLKREYGSYTAVASRLGIRKQSLRVRQPRRARACVQRIAQVYACDILD